MYTQQSNGRPLRGSHPVQQRRLFYLTRDPRAGQRSGNGGHGGHQQAAGGEVRMQRQSPTMAAVQGRDGLQGGSVRPQLPQGLSITRPRENPQNTSPMQEQNLELETYLSENFSTLQQILSDTTDRYVQSPGYGHWECMLTCRAIRDSIVCLPEMRLSTNHASQP
ncbi:hypothetical protein CABS03_15190 [Colletotrichum abscissum]|uniref:Uncharacterized protein n=1 Tax=Colletotrichum limetticola TaxID=1209924 RepID=A0ABQ9P795_9PEZI|nr:hypothetical protein CLIM01_14742 [Colletotrichum limetticola]